MRNSIDNQLYLLKKNPNPRITNENVCDGFMVGKLG